MALLALINEWRESTDATEIVFWLNGKPGEGKSTIAKTIAILAENNNVLGGSYFFSRREDITLRSATLVIPTLVFQLSREYPSFRTEILNLLEKGRPWMHMPISEQAKAFKTALENYAAPSPPPLIILDALDECDPGSAIELLSVLLGFVLRRTGNQPVRLKVLITSRPEIDLTATFDKYSKQEYRLFEMKQNIVGNDIRRYLQGSLRLLPTRCNIQDLDRDWFTNEQLDKLAEHAGTLFIYAATAVRFIETKGPPGPKTKLNMVLQQSSSNQETYAMLDAIYDHIISHFISTSLTYYLDVVGSMLVLQDSLPVKAMAQLIGLDHTDVTATLRPLQSIITQSQGTTSAPTFYHASFNDYATSERCRSALRVCKEEREAYVTGRCLILMTKELRRNIAGISDHTSDVSTIPGLVERISPEIAYAVRFWGSHLLHSTRLEDVSKLRDLVGAFIGLPLIFWIEVCGVIGMIGPAIACVQDALKWMVRLQYNLTQSSYYGPFSGRRNVLQQI